jgi:hypothetical protein
MMFQSFEYLYSFAIIQGATEEGGKDMLFV